MYYPKLIAIAAAATAVLASACNAPEPAVDPTREEAARAETVAAENARKRTEAGAELEKRAADLDRRWTEMEGKLASKTVKATAGLTAEVKEDVQNVRQAIADLKTTTPENWWERHERAMERTADDIEADVRRFVKGKAAAPAPETAASAGPFDSRRDRFVTAMRSRVESMEAELKDVRVTGTQETELEDTRARLTKLKDDVDRLRQASAEDWWDITVKRVSEYIDRVEDSIRRLDDNKAWRRLNRGPSADLARRDAEGSRRDLHHQGKRALGRACMKRRSRAARVGQSQPEPVDGRGNPDGAWTSPPCAPGPSASMNRAQNLTPPSPAHCECHPEHPAERPM